MKASHKIFGSVRTVVISLVAFCLAAPACAGIFSVTPVRIYMTPRDKAVAVTITNDGDEDLVMQADIYDWKQNPAGEDNLTLTEDMLLYPPIIKVPAKSHQVVRLARLVPPQPSQQMTYRMIVREIPEAKPAKERMQVQVALAFSMPVFITPPGAKNKLDCTVQRTAANAVYATCENTGNAYAQLLDFELADTKGNILAKRDQGAYILPTIKHTFEIKSPDKRIPGGKAELRVKLDDGTKQAFDVTLPE